MKQFLFFVAAMLASVSLNAADPKPTVAVEDSVEVTVVGTLRTGIMAIGGETTGTTITAKGITWELEFDKGSEALSAKAKSLEKKQVVVKGTLEQRKGVEINQRWIVHVTSLKPAGK